MSEYKGPDLTLLAIAAYEAIRKSMESKTEEEDTQCETN